MVILFGGDVGGGDAGGGGGGGGGFDGWAMLGLDWRRGAGNLGLSQLLAVAFVRGKTSENEFIHVLRSRCELLYFTTQRDHRLG